MAEEIQNKLGTSLFKQCSGSYGGCISSGNVYETDNGKVFVKKNNKPGADIMFQGEFFGLKAMCHSPLRVPKPIIFGTDYIVMEYVEMSSLNKHADALGLALARMHKGLNIKNNAIGCGQTFVQEFGFETPTCCGFLPLCNDWQKDWILFYASQRLQPQIEMIQKEYGDRDIGELWSRLQRRIPELFSNIKITPSLLHGDLWSGNAAETHNEPIVYDPAAFYGHDEFDLAIAKMFGGFNQSFFNAYHKEIPQQPGFRQREDLYILFHQLNHWNHFGQGYKASSLKTLRKLLNAK